MAYGRYFEEFTPGQVLKHWPGRTISEADCTWFALLIPDQLRHLWRSPVLEADHP